MSDLKNEIKMIRKYVSKFDANTINDIYNKNCIKLINKDNEEMAKLKNAKHIDKTDPKYIMGFKVIKAIVKNINGLEINELNEFKDIDRVLIIMDSNKQIIEGMSSEFFKVFTKTSFKWYTRKTTKAYAMTFIWYLCNELGYHLIRKQRDITENVNGAYYRKTHSFFSIV